jgi:predicted Zn-dependent protease
MGSLSEERPPEFLSTHPEPENRQAELQRQIPTMLALNPNRVKAPITEIEIVR